MLFSLSKLKYSNRLFGFRRVVKIENRKIKIVLFTFQHLFFFRRLFSSIKS
jgi:hypothetical protein